MIFNGEKAQKIDIPTLVNEHENYFGSDCSEYETEKEKCSVALVDSL